LALNISTTQVWGIPAAAIVSRPKLRRTVEARGLTALQIGPATVATATAFESLAELLLDAAARELLLQRLGSALTKTSRQVNTLEQRVTPTLLQAVIRTRRDLEERERDEHARLGWVLRATAREPQRSLAAAPES
jgi:vacuolar-type H+-ATPase subunit D/Vma8